MRKVFKIDSENFRIIEGLGMVVRISAYPGFGKWLYGQTIPMMPDEDNPYDWAYVCDWERFMRNLPVID